MAHTVLLANAAVPVVALVSSFSVVALHVAEVVHGRISWILRDHDEIDRGVAGVHSVVVAQESPGTVPEVASIVVQQRLSQVETVDQVDLVAIAAAGEGLVGNPFGAVNRGFHPTDPNQVPLEFVGRVTVLQENKVERCEKSAVIVDQRVHQKMPHIGVFDPLGNVQDSGRYD